MKFPIETPRKQVNWDPKGWYCLLRATLALLHLQVPHWQAWMSLLPAARVLRLENAPGNCSVGGRRAEAVWVRSPDRACHIIVVPLVWFHNLFKDIPSWLFVLKFHRVLVFAFDFVSVPVCVCPLFLVIFVSLADGWGASHRTWNCTTRPRVSSRGRVSWQHLRLRSAVAVPGVALLS